MPRVHQVEATAREPDGPGLGPLLPDPGVYLLMRKEFRARIGHPDREYHFDAEFHTSYLFLPGNEITISLMPRAAMRSNYITSGRAARILGITKRTLHNWVKAGRIPGPEVNPDNGYLQWTLADVDTARHVLTEDSGDSTRNR